MKGLEENQQYVPSIIYLMQCLGIRLEDINYKKKAKKALTRDWYNYINLNLILKNYTDYIYQVSSGHNRECIGHEMYIDHEKP